eukprot:gene56068-74856_t
MTSLQTPARTAASSLARTLVQGLLATTLACGAAAAGAEAAWPVYAKLGYKPEDLTAVSVGSSFSQTLVCNPSTGAKTLKDLARIAKDGKLAYASGGAGVPGHLAMELWLAQVGVDMEHIPYKGPAPAAQDVIGGTVPCGFLAGPTVLPHIRSGRLTALAVS